MRHELFEVGSYDYSDLDDRIDKPVEWTEDDLKLIAENYRGGIPLTSEHDNIYVGIGNNIEYEEGKLFIEVPDELDMEGKGLSPKVDVLLKDKGDSFGIDSMSLIDVGVTKNPRKITLLNSEISGDAGATGPKGDTGATGATGQGSDEEAGWKLPVDQILTTTTLPTGVSAGYRVAIVTSSVMAIKEYNGTSWDTESFDPYSVIPLKHSGGIQMYLAKSTGPVYMGVEYGVFGKFRFMTQATYDALSSYDNDTIYFVRSS